MIRTDRTEYMSREKFMAELMRYKKGSVSRRHFLGVTGLGLATGAKPGEGRQRGVRHDTPAQGRQRCQEGGHVLDRLGHIPRPGESFAWGGWRFEVMDYDDRRIDKLLVSRLG